MECKFHATRRALLQLMRTGIVRQAGSYDSVYRYRELRGQFVGALGSKTDGLVHAH